MSLEIREGTCPQSRNLFEGDDWIGKIEYDSPEEEGDKPYWTVLLWSLMGTGKEWEVDAGSLEEAVHCAHALYAESYLPERRELKRPVPGTRVISTPTGGQRRR